MLFAGYYADSEAQCQVFHICTADGQGGLAKYSFLCPNGTIFNQNYFICDWWFNFDCSEAEGLYSLNEKIAAEREAASGNSASDSAQSTYGAAAIPPPPPAKAAPVTQAPAPVEDYEDEAAAPANENYGAPAAAAPQATYAAAEAERQSRAFRGGRQQQGRQGKQVRGGQQQGRRGKQQFRG